MAMTAPKLTEAQIREAVTCYQAGEKATVIAADLGVSPSAVGYHASKRTVLRLHAPAGTYCGTRRGYAHHKRLGTKACAECRAANAAAVRAVMARKSAAERTVA